MSNSSCNGASHNVYHAMPPIMADGRNFSNWNSNAVINQNTMNKNNIKSAFDYRQYLVNNADNIISINQNEACDQCCNCPPIYNSSKSKANAPYLYSSCLDNSTPPGYETSDLKTQYLSSAQLQSRLKTPIITQEELLAKGYPNFN